MKFNIKYFLKSELALKSFIVFLVLMKCLDPFSQTLIMGSGAAVNGATINSPCGAVLLDPGGNSAYPSSQNIVVTFCAPAGQYLQLNFTQLDTETGFDFVKIFDGSTTASPLIGTYEGSTIPASSIYSSLGGCITIRFKSDGSTEFEGFSISINCTSTGPPQMPSCITSTPAGETCANAEPICQLNGYCGNTSSLYTADAWGIDNSFSCTFLGICNNTGLAAAWSNNGASVENDSYIMFTASATSISFDIWITNSLNGDGIQLMVFEPNVACGTGDVTSHYFNGQMLPGGPYTVNVTGLTPGNTYYIMIDGFAGDDCDYVIGAGSGISLPVQLTASDLTPCTGDVVNLTASGGDGTYTWGTSPILSTPSGANATATLPSTPGSYTITVNSVSTNPLCPDASTSVTLTSTDCQNIATCVQSPFCSGSLTFPAGTDQTDADITYPLNNYDCLFSTPNPAWYYMEVATPGNLSIGINNSASVDVDFIMYGPFTDLNDVNINCNNFGNGTTSNTVVDCSFSSSANETANVANVQTGEIYVLLITNFSNSSTNITFQNNGSATTDCSIVSACNFSGFTGTTSACNVNNQYDISGTISYTNPPTTGTLTLINSCGGTQTFNAPFGTSSNFTFSGLTGDGGSCTISASFSDGTCSATLDYTAPLCSCPADVGTYNVTVNGSNVNQNLPIKLCYNSQLGISSNNNWVPPNETTGGNDPNPPTYTTGIYWLIYTCPPTVALTPAQAAANHDSIPADPCFVGVISGTPSWTDVNDLSVINSFPSGTFTNNTVYYVPITMYDTINGFYSYVIQPALQCYELGSPIAVQYLPEITYTQTTNCANGTASVTLSGGSPQINGTNFTVVPGSLSPATANFVNTTTGNGGTIVLGNLTTGSYSFDIKDDNGCPKSISGNFIGPQTATLSYPDNTYCLNDANATPNMIGTPGGTYSSGAGLNINSTTGIINFQNSIPGAYTVTYTTPGPLCPTSSTFNLIIEDFPIVDGGPDQTLCVGTPVILSGSGAASYTWNNGLIDGYPYLPNLGQNEFTVIGSSLAGCNGYDTVIVNVITECNPDIDIIFWVPNTFTPDGDQYNQTFKPLFFSGYDPFGYDLFIYNRWGELIWESHDLSVGWDGSYHEGVKVADGTYTWKIRFKLINNDEKRTVVGHVNVIR